METNQQARKLKAEEFDDRTIYCGMLGQELTFKYCRLTADGRFCRRILECWHDKIDIGNYARYFFSYDEMRGLFRAPASKMSTLIDLITKSSTNG